MEKDTSSLSIKMDTTSINDAINNLDNFRKKSLETARATDSITVSLTRAINKFTKMSAIVSKTNRIVNKYNNEVNKAQKIQFDISDPTEIVNKSLENLQIYIDRFNTDNSINKASSNNEQRKAQVLKLEKEEEKKKKDVHDPLAIADITKKYTLAKEELLKSWDKEDKNQVSWIDGLKSGLEEYFNKAQDLAGIAKNFATKTMEQLTGMILTFVKTGKLNFKDFAKSIITNIIDITQKLVVFQALRSIFTKWGWLKASASTGGLQEAYTGGYIHGYALGGGVGYNDKPGGFTGYGNKYQPAGIVHKGEFVFTKEATKRLGANYLYALMNEKESSFDKGGYVGGLTPVAFNRQANRSFNGINVNANVAVNMPTETPSSFDANNANTQSVHTQIGAIIQKQLNETFKKSVSPGGELYNVMKTMR